MKRTPLRRTTPLRRSRRPVGQRARARRHAGGPRVAGRPAVSVAAWEAVKLAVWLRDHGRCRAPGCPREAEDPHHVERAGRGASDDADGIVCLCRAHHRQVDAPYARGRLVIQALGEGRFLFTTVIRASKWAPLR